MSCFYQVCAHPYVTRHHGLHTFKAHDPFFICSQTGDMKKNKKWSIVLPNNHKTRKDWWVKCESARQSRGLKDNLSFCFSFQLLPMDCRSGCLCPPSVRDNTTSKMWPWQWFCLWCYLLCTTTGQVKSAAHSPTLLEEFEAYFY